MSATAEAYILFLFFIIVMFLLYGFFQKKLKIQEDMLSNHNLNGLSLLVQNRLARSYNVDFAQPEQPSVYNISSRVQGHQNHPQYPDGYVSVDHITVTNELNKPPKYDDAPPSYEEAIQLAMAHNNSMQTFQDEQAHSHQQPQSSSSSTPTLAIVVPAAPHRTTE